MLSKVFNDYLLNSSQLIYQDCGVLTDFVHNKCPNIIRYINTIKNNFWPDWLENIRTIPVGFFRLIVELTRLTLGFRILNEIQKCII